jgi:hypothetical protein
LNASVGPKDGGPAVQACCFRFACRERPLWQHADGAAPEHLGFAPAEARAELHFERATHPDPVAVRAALRNVASGPVRLVVGSGFSFAGRIEHLFWSEACDDDGRFVSAVAEVVLVGKEVKDVVQSLARK